MKKIFKNKKFYIISAIILTIVGIAAGFISGLFKANDSLNYKAYVGSYETNKNPITEFTYVETPADVEMKNFYDYNADSNEFTPNNPSTVLGSDLSKYTIRTNEAKYIGISTMTELAAFSMLCSPDKDPNYYASYLDFNYVLTDNIKPDSALQFIPIGVDSSVEVNNVSYAKRAFTGTFNGNGYDITGLQFITITDINGDSFELNYPIKKSAINYFAMFSLNEGTIGNFGLINPNISFNYTAVGNKFDKVAMICGENKGTIEKVYVRDLRSASNNKSGIMAFGGYIISGLVYSNAEGGELKNSYVAYNSVVNGSVFDSHDFNEILYTNAGTVENLYVYNQSVQSIEDQAANATTYPVGNDGVAIGTEKKITYTNGQIKKRKLFGTYCYTYQKQSQDEKEVETKYLNEYINSKDNATWYTATIADFNTVDAAYNMSTLMPTPILRGITYNTTNENDKYFVITQERDYAFMYEMFNASSYFASSDFTYQIEADINLSGLAAKRYTYSGGIGATIRGKVASYSSATIGDSASTVPTIYHPDYENTFTTVEGFNAYGLFPYVKKGTIKDLNVITVSSKSGNTIGTEEIDVTSTNGNVAAFGTVCGYLDSGKIENVNVYEKIKLIGKAKAFIGGAVGVLTGQAVATDVTNTGDITVNITDVTEDPIDYMKGISIGGVVGYIHNSTADIKNSLNTANITVNGITTVDYTVGGILGAGYTNKIENVENIGKLTFDNKYNTLFIAGIIGRHLGMKEQSDGLTNYGDIEITDNGNLTYICGVLNATPITSTENGLNKADAYLLNSNYKAIGQYYYNATMLTNGSNITINNTSHTYRANTHFTDVINVVTSECIVKLSAVYNLAYKQDYDGTKSNIDTDNNNVQIIDMNTYHTFSPVLNYEYNSSKYDALEISTAYNLRNIKYTMSSAITGNIDLNYTNVINGDNVTLINVRNEGNMTFDITETFTAKLYASGIIKSISANAKADAVVNGGDIKLNHSSMINGDLYIAGICYENHNTTLNTSIDKYNPNKGTFDAKAIGAINNAINAGAIEVTNTAYASNITYRTYGEISNNNQFMLGFRLKTVYSGNYINGNINVSGITNVNYSIITNTFNIGDLFTANVNQTDGYLMNTAGIVDLNIGQYAYILNSANNGEIKSINLWNDSSVKTDLTAAGIVARNDLTSSLSTYTSNTNGHSKQVIAFTINYGSIYAYNYKENVEGANAIPSSKASGIVGMGLLNVVNVLNYGNIFGNETISGIFGVVYFERFQTEVNSSSNKVILANTINYGNTFILYKGYNSGERKLESNDDYYFMTYELFKNANFDVESFTYTGNLYTTYTTTADGTYARLNGHEMENTWISTSVSNKTINRSDYASYEVTREVSNKSIAGSIFSIINFNNSDNAAFVVIRYLINFEENVPLVGFEPATKDTVVVDKSTIYSAYSHIDVRNNGSGQMIRDTYMGYGSTGNYVVYSPLTNEDGRIKTVTSNSTINVLNPDTDLKVEEIEYSGVFSRNFEFYKAINKSYSLKDINDHPTDAFLSDFFQFVEYSYINDALVEKIGWKEIAYIAAANNFARTTSSVDLLLQAMDENEESYIDFKTYALNNTGIWTRWSTDTILLDIINNLINNNNDTSELTTMLKYIFSSESTSNVLITTSIRNEIFDFVSESLDDITLKNILNELITYEKGYSKLLADSILDTDSDVYTFMNEYISQCLSLNELKSLLSDYITILGDDTTYYFNYSVNMQRRYDTLTSIFSSITDDGYFYELLCDLLDINSTSDISDKLKMYQGYQTLTNDYKYQLYARIIANNSETNLNTYLSTMEGEIGYYARLIETGYVTSNIQDTYTSIGSGTTNNSSSSVINDRIELWNKIKYTSTFMEYINSRMAATKYYFLATEHNNTYQSLTAPSPNGSYLGDLSYYYTSSVTPSTYFYGPYKDSNGSLWTIPNKSYEDSYYLDQVWMGTEKWHSVFVSDSLKYVETYNYFDNINNYYICYNNQTSGYENEIGTESIEGVLPATLYFYEYGYTGANNQFVSSSTIRYNPWQQTGKTDFDGMTGATRTDIGGATLKTTDAILHFGNNDIHLSNAFISYHVINRNKFQIIDANGNQYTINGAFTVEDPNVAEGSLDAIKHTSVGDKCTINPANNTLSYTDASYVVWADFIYRYAKPYYFSEVSTKYHSTKRTGLYQRTGDSKDKGVIWFTHKTSKNNPIYTTQYMDYTVNQLLELDGYYTKFADGTTQCDDERNIINSLFNTYLCNDKTTFEKIIRKALMEVLTNDVNSSLLTAKNGSSSYEFTSATTSVNSISINRAGGITSSNVQINSTNWYMSNDTIIGYITHNGQYYNNGYKNRTYKYEISIFGITFSNNQTLNTGYVIKIRTGNENYINNTSLTYQNDVLTFKFRHRPNNNNNYYYDFTVPINISLRPSSISVSDGFTVDRSGTIDFLIKQNGNLVATVTKNNGSTTCALNETDYVFKKYNLNTSNTEFLTFICTPKNKINYKYINQFVNANINSDTLINSKVPFEYLINTGSQTVKEYLISLASNQTDYKTMLITNATNSESKYYALIDKLLDLGVLSNADYLNAKNVTVTGANGVTASNINNAALNITLANDSTSTLYGGVTYSSTNPRGFNATTLTLSGFDVANIGIIAKASSANATMTITTTHSDGTVENLNSQTKKVVSNTNSSTYTGAVDTTKAYLYVISQNALYDMVPVNKFKFDTEYFTYNSSTNTYTSELLFDSTKTYYRNDNGTPRNVTFVNATTGEGNYDNNTQLYSSNRLRNQDKVNDTSVVYYERTINATPSITLTMSNNVVIYGIYQGSNNIISYDYNIDNYLSSVFCGTSNNHTLDLSKILTNLLPIHTDEYATSLYQTDLENVLLQYLSDNPVDDYTLINFYKLVACFSNETFSKLIDELYSADLGNIKDIYIGILEAMSSKSGGYAYIADFINIYHKLGNDYSDRFITAAYIASDYENLYQQSLSSNNKALLANSQMKQLLSFNNNIQYIKSDGSFDNDKFDALIEYIGLGSSNDVYGIYALASSLGIQNGDFIPDNLNLASMEAYYQADTNSDTNYGFILIDAESADWRKYGKTPASAPYNTRYDDTPNNATTYSDSVNYAFLIEMKQLKKSIATTLFELDLEVAVESQLTTTYTMYSSEDLIEEYKLRDGTKKKAILYYVPTEYFNQITSVNNNKNLNVDEIIISTTAKAYKFDSNTEIVDKKTNSNNFATYSSGSLVKCNTLTNIDYYNNSDLADGYVIQNAVKVVAEETSVYRYYDIVLLPVDFSFKIEYQQISNVTSYASFGTTSSTVAATDGVVSIKLESPVFTKIIKNDDANTVTFDGTSIYYELTYASASVNEDTFKTDGTYSDSVDGYLYTLNNSTYTKVTSGSYSSSTQYYKQVYVITADTERKANKDYYVSFTKATEKTFAANKTYYTLSGSTYSKATVTAGATIPSSTDYYIAGKAFTLPKGFDLSKYVSISLPGSNTAIENAFTFTDIAGNYIVKENGNADITLDISDDLAKGTYDLTINLCGCTQTLVLIKNPNNDVNLTMKYDGINLSFTKEGNEYVAESDILWGTPFTIGDLKSLAYADSYELAPNATMTVTIDEIVDSYTPNNVSYNVWTYKVTILVTAENGEDTKTYVHKLKEMNPFTANEAYATVYKQGIQILKPALNVAAGDSTTDSNYVLNNVTTVSYPRNDGEPDYRIKYDMSKIYYNGSSEALNDERIHDYNEYTLSVVNGNEVYTLITDESKMTALNPVELLYAGMSVQINNDIDTGTYTFAFVYRTYTLNEEYYEITYALANVDADTFTTNGSYSDSIDGYLYTLNEDTYTKVTSGDYSSSTQYYKQVYTYTSDIAPEEGKTYYTLSDSVYSVANLTNVTSFTETRELVFPKVKVIKTPAVDAVVESATFINNYEALGSLATLINPAKSIVPSTDAYNKDGGEPLYDSLIAGDGQKMTVDATDRSIKYKITDGNTTYNYETETDDYYIVGTTSNANLKNYAPSVALRSEYAKFFQVLSQRKIDDYDGRFNGAKTEDATNQDFVVLNDHKGSYVYLYVLFNTDSVFLVQTYLKDMSYGKIYKTDSKTGIGQKVGDVSSDNLKGRGLYNIEFDYNGTTYKASTLNGDTSTRNSSLYMDYTKATTNNRFWYVSYVVFSEDFFLNGLGDNVPNVEDIATSDIWGHRAKFYNIAVIDISNNIRFTIEVDAPDEFRDILSSLYVTLSYNKYVSSVLTDSKQLSVYAEYQDKLYNSDSAEVTTKVSYVSGGTYYFYDLTTESRQAVGWTGDRMDTYIPEYALQLMPTAYYKFYINLPAGYEATYTVTEGKENTYKKNPNADEAGSYLPPSSLVTQDIKITITIKTKDDYEAISTWGINTSDVIVTEVKPDSSVNPTEEES